MKNKSLLPILLLAAFALGACNVGGQSSKESQEEPASSEVQPSDTTQYGVAIANKAALQGEWYAGTTRDLDVTLTPAANPLSELGKNLTVTSSDVEVVAVTGLGLSALKAGTATITVKYHEATDTVEVTILDNSAKGKYGVAHEGTAADPFTNEDALAVAKSEKYEGEVYYVKGKVASFYNAPGSRDDGMVAWFLEPAQAGGEKFEIYKCFKEDGSALTDDDIWVGGEATAYGAFTKYNSQYETSSAKFVSCEGNKPQPSKTVDATFAEALAAGAALEDGANTWDSYRFQGYVTLKSGTDYYLTATKGETLAKTKSDAAHGERDVYATAIELYGAGKVAELSAKLLEGAKVEVTMKLKNYHGQVENLVALTDADVVVKEPGTAWSVPEPTVANRTLKEFIDGENTKALAYNVKATIKSWKDATSDKDQFGNMVLTDGTNDLVIYGASATATALAWDNAGAYSFTNPKDFLTNEITSALNKGTEITMKLIRADYQGKVQGTGVITAVTQVEATAIALDKTSAEIEVGDSVQLTATLTPSNASSKITWSSSDDTVATVVNGKVAGIKAGTATITAKVSDTIKAECAVTVKASSVVAQEGDFALHLDDIAEGDYIIHYDGKAIKAEISSNRLAYAEVTPTSNVIVAEKAAANIVWHIAKSGDNWSIYNAGANKYMAGNGTKNQAALVDSVTDKATWTITKDADGKFEIQNISNAAANVNSYLRNNGTYGFATYGNTTGGKLSLFKKVAAAAQPEIAQPTGAFRGLAKSKAGTFLPVDMILAADSVTLYANGDAVAVTSYSWDKVKGEISIVTDAAGYGTIVAKLDSENNAFTITSLNGTAALASLDLTYAVKLSGNALFLDCEQDTAGLQNVFLRRKMESSWVAANSDDKIYSSNDGKVGKGLAIKCWADGKIAVTLKNDLSGVTGKNASSVGCWIYNPSTTKYSTTLFYYKGAGNTDNTQAKVFELAPQSWTFCQCGLIIPNADGTGYNFGENNTLYNFQFYTEKVNTTLVFDNFCIYR